MKVFSSEIVQFIVLILPGFLGLFVYRPFVHKGTADDGKESDITKAMLFGLPGYLTATYFFENIAIQVLLSVLISVAFGILWGYSRCRLGYFEYLPASWHSNKNKISRDTPQQRGLEYLYRQYYDKQRLEGGLECSQVAFVYSISDPEKVVSGEIISYGVEINDITLNISPVITKEQIKAQLKEDHRKIHQWNKIINLDNGLVLEVVNAEKSVIDEIYEKQKQSDNH